MRLLYVIIVNGYENLYENIIFNYFVFLNKFLFLNVLFMKMLVISYVMLYLIIIKGKLMIV